MGDILIGVLISLLAAAFFSSAEMIVVTVNKIKLQHLKEEGSGRAAQVLDWLTDPEAIISAVLVANNIAHVACSALTTLVLARLFMGDHRLMDAIPIVTTLLVTPLMLMLGEILPKDIGRRYSNNLIFLVDRPVRLVMVVLTPLLRVVKFSNAVVARWLGINPTRADITVSREEFSHWMKESVASGMVQQETEKMIKWAFDFRKTTVREIMVPLTEVRALSGKGSRVSDLLDFARTNKFTRYPVYSDRIDCVIGVVNIYDVLVKQPHDSLSLEEFIRPIGYVPNTLPVDKLFFRMQKQREQMVAVVDEYGGCDGIVTVEDIMEELVGDIAEEHEQFQPMIRELGGHEYEVDASMDIDDLNDELDLQLPKEGYETLAGFLITSFEKIPEVGDSFVINEMFFEILEMDSLAITKVKMVLDPTLKNDTGCEA